MNEEKKIEEMAKCCPYYHKGECCVDVLNICNCDLMCEMFGVFANLVKEGYRKQSEGEWVYKYSGEMLLGTDAPLDFECSLCGMNATDPFCYCPNCGAKMKGGAE